MEVFGQQPTRMAWAAGQQPLTAAAAGTMQNLMYPAQTAGYQMCYPAGQVQMAQGAQLVAAPQLVAGQMMAGTTMVPTTQLVQTTQMVPATQMVAQGTWNQAGYNQQGYQQGMQQWPAQPEKPSHSKFGRGGVKQPSETGRKREKIRRINEGHEYYEGDILEWHDKGGFGTISMPYNVRHEKRDGRGGKLQVLRKDLRPPLKNLTVGMKVRFKLYSDNLGLGGHEVEAITKPMTEIVSRLLVELKGLIPTTKEMDYYVNDEWNVKKIEGAIKAWKATNMKPKKKKKKRKKNALRVPLTSKVGLLFAFENDPEVEILDDPQYRGTWIPVKVLDLDTKKAKIRVMDSAPARGLKWADKVYEGIALKHIRLRHSTFYLKVRDGEEYLSAKIDKILLDEKLDLSFVDGSSRSNVPLGLCRLITEEERLKQPGASPEPAQKQKTRTAAKHKDGDVPVAQEKEPLLNVNLLSHGAGEMQWGFSAPEVYPIRIDNVSPGGQACRFGIKVGAVVGKVEDQTVTAANWRDLFQLLVTGQPLKLGISNPPSVEPGSKQSIQKDKPPEKTRPEKKAVKTTVKTTVKTEQRIPEPKPKEKERVEPKAAARPSKSRKRSRERERSPRTRKPSKFTNTRPSKPRSPRASPKPQRAAPVTNKQTPHQTQRAQTPAQLPTPVTKAAAPTSHTQQSAQTTAPHTPPSSQTTPAKRPREPSSDQDNMAIMKLHKRIKLLETENKELKSSNKNLLAENQQLEARGKALLASKKSYELEKQKQIEAGKRALEESRKFMESEKRKYQKDAQHSKRELERYKNQTDDWLSKYDKLKEDYRKSQRKLEKLKSSSSDSSATIQKLKKEVDSWRHKFDSLTDKLGDLWDQARGKKPGLSVFTL